MAQYKYDKDGNYTGKVLSESEHQRKQNETPEHYTCRYCLDPNVSDYNLAYPKGKHVKYERVWWGKVYTCKKCSKLPKEKNKSKIEGCVAKMLLFILVYLIIFFSVIFLS